MPVAKRFAPRRVPYVVAACFLASSPASGDVYKCLGGGGIPVYQEEPCAAGKELRNFQTDPPPLTILPAQGAGNAPPIAPKELSARSGKPDAAARSAKTADAAERKHLRIGMSAAEVQARIGAPDMTAGGKNGGDARWTYLPAPADPETITTLTLAKGTVTGVERKIVKK